ncbi:unnamed protein product [Withania somnifera]
MGSGDGDGEDDRTFRVNFTAEGFAKLRERVKEKLKEFMGDYTDDTLVKESVRQPEIAATRRLLQFAVRDAVATSRPSNFTLAPSPSVKRLRSVVSTSVEDSSLQEHPQRIRSVARGSAALATAIRAVAEAAKDVTKGRSSANVFDRLGYAADVPDPSIQLEESSQVVAEDVQDRSFADANETYSTYIHRNDYSGKHIGKPMLRDDAVVAYDSASDDEADPGSSTVNRRTMNASRTGAPVKNIGENPLIVEHSVAYNGENILDKSQKDQDRPIFAPGAPHQPMNIPLNVNTWKSPQYQEARQTLEIENRRSAQSSGGLAEKSNLLLTKASTCPITVTNGIVKPYVDTHKESQKTASVNQGLYSSGPPTEDADSRTIFVNNVHFAATKDSLSRHFNKFGEVLKVVILIDAATGQPKGSAYVEFMRKESAVNALSLDGTSFMSRILKVVRKSSATPEAASVPVWPRVTRGGPFAASRFGRVPFPRGIPTLYRSRLPVRHGARSMQWKRGAQTTSTENSGLATPSSNAVSSPISQSLTYIRTESKTNGNSSAA